MIRSLLLVATIAITIGFGSTAFSQADVASQVWKHIAAQNERVRFPSLMKMSSSICVGTRKPSFDVILNYDPACGLTQIEFASFLLKDNARQKIDRHGGDCLTKSFRLGLMAFDFASLGYCLSETGILPLSTKLRNKRTGIRAWRVLVESDYLAGRLAMMILRFCIGQSRKSISNETPKERILDITSECRKNQVKDARRVLSRAEKVAENDVCLHVGYDMKRRAFRFDKLAKCIEGRGVRLPREQDLP